MVLPDEDEQEYALCSLTEGKAECTPLDLYFRDETITFRVEGKNEIHLTGHVLEENDGDSDDDSDEEEEAAAAPAAAAKKAAAAPAAAADDESEDDDEDEDDDDEDDSEDEAPAGAKARPADDDDDSSDDDDEGEDDDDESEDDESESGALMPSSIAHAAMLRSKRCRSSDDRIIADKLARPQRADHNSLYGEDT
jgi:hypothetical protein